MIIDSHCHLNMLDLSHHNHNVDNAIQKARQQGVEHFLCVGVALETFAACKEIAYRHKDISLSVGVHPNEQGVEEASVARLVALAQEPKVIAIGETGLDYYRSTGDLEWQRQRFRVHIAAAKQAGLPLIIHSRAAREDTIAIMRCENAQNVRGVMHCFTESWQMAHQAMELGFYISFSGIVTFKNAKEVQEVAKNVPLDRMLIETDCPYLAPVPMRGKPNEPAYVRYVAEFLAQLRGEKFDTIAEKTTENFYKLFSVG